MDAKVCVTRQSRTKLKYRRINVRYFSAYNASLGDTEQRRAHLANMTLQQRDIWEDRRMYMTVAASTTDTWSQRWRSSVYSTLWRHWIPNAHDTQESPHLYHLRRHQTPTPPDTEERRHERTNWRIYFTTGHMTRGDQRRRTPDTTNIKAFLRGETLRTPLLELVRFLIYFCTNTLVRGLSWEAKHCGHHCRCW